MTFTLGQVVQVNAVARRERGDNQRWSWERDEIIPTIGIVVGTRVKQNGYKVKEYEDGYSWWEWHRTGSVPVVLVATAVHKAHLIGWVADVFPAHRDPITNKPELLYPDDE